MTLIQKVVEMQQCIDMTGVEMTDEESVILYNKQEM